MSRIGFTSVLASNGAEAIDAVKEPESSKYQTMGVRPRFDVILVRPLNFEISTLRNRCLRDARWIFKCRSCKPQ